MIADILGDSRPILSVRLASGREYHAEHGRRIVAYREHGDGAYVPWFAVYAKECEWSEEPYVRVNSRHVESVVYE